MRKIFGKSDFEHDVESVRRFTTARNAIPAMQAHADLIVAKEQQALVRRQIEQVHRIGNIAVHPTTQSLADNELPTHNNIDERLYYPDLEVAQSGLTIIDHRQPKAYHFYDQDRDVS